MKFQAMILDDKEQKGKQISLEELKDMFKNINLNPKLANKNSTKENTIGHTQISTDNFLRLNQSLKKCS